MAAPETVKPITAGTAAGTGRGLRTRAEGARDHRDLRPGARRPPVPGRRLGGGQQEDLHPPRRGGHRRKRTGRPGEPDGQADEDPRRAARRAAPEERRHHRGAAGEGHRQVRQARRHHRLHRADDEPRPDTGRQRDLRHQGARRGDLLAAPALQEDLVRDGSPDARGAGARGRARRHPAVPDPGQHPDVAGADGARRPDRRHRRPADGPRRVQLGHAGLRRRRRQFDDDHRRDREHRGSRPQHAAVQDLGLRLRLLGRRQPDHRGVDLRRDARPAAEGRRLSRHTRAEGECCARRCGTTSAIAPSRPSPSPRSSSRRSPASRFRPTASSSSSTATASAASTTTPARSSPRSSPSTSTRASTRRWT